MKEQGRRMRGRPERRWLGRVKDDIKEKGLSGRRCTWRYMHHIKVGIR